MERLILLTLFLLVCFYVSADANEPEVKRYCIYCGQPLKLKIGAEHIRCALKHPHLSVAGWTCYLIGWIIPSARDAEEKIKDRVREKGKKELKMPLSP
jgi:LSD1 subclass zinc finger protein